jgi:hypothetical protein
MANPPRYRKMVINVWGINWLHKRNPWVAMACSIALPGLGHFYCGAYFRGFTLMSWEITVNQIGRVNHAIFLTALGHLDKAQAVLNYRWAMIYPVFYVLAMWDSYRLAVDMNKLVEIEERQPVRQFAVMDMISIETTFLSKKNPWLAAILSIFLGGAGHFYNFKIIKAVMLMGWHLAVWLNAGLNLALLETLHGNWKAVHQVIDYQWLLFWPSMHLFNIWNAYSDTVELNKLYNEEVEYFIRRVTAQEPPDPTPGVTP